MNNFFTDDFYKQNRARLRKQVPGDIPIVITANGLLQRGGDSAFLFAQDANFWYLTGIDEPDILLVFTPESEFLIVPSRNASRTAFDGAVDEALLTRTSGIVDIVGDQEGWERLTELTKRGQVATPGAPPRYIESYGLYTNPARLRLQHALKKLHPDMKFSDIAPLLAVSRMSKQAPEISAIRAAIDITITSMETVMQPNQLNDYANESEIEADLTRSFRRQGAMGHAFDPIVAGGLRGCILHNLANNGMLGVDEFIVMDVGAECDHYAADITRTIMRGTPSKRQLSVHDAVVEVQRYAFGLLKPGVQIREYEAEVEAYMGKELQKLGLIKKIEHEAVRHYYPHSTSHFLGLNVHDSGDYRLPLEAGMVLTVEPGIYIPDEAIGIRIEDDILITDTGIEILSDRLTRSAA